MDPNLLVNNRRNLMAWLMFVTGSVVYFSFNYPLITVCCRQQEKLPAIHPMTDVSSISTAEIFLWFNKTPEERKSILFQVKEILEKEKRQCLVDKKRLDISLKFEREIHRKMNFLLMKKLKILQREKNQRQHLISKLKEVNAILKAKVNRHELINYSSADTPYPGVDNYTRYTVARLGMSPLAVIEPLNPKYGPVINDVLSFGFPLTIPACRDLSLVTSPSVFIAVFSAPGNFDKRNGIRRTWRTHLSNVSFHNSSMVVAGFAFILGLTDSNATQIKIQEESQTHGDLIQIEMADFYRNLSLKVAGLFNWLYRHCHPERIDFLFKVDDDVYVNVRNLAQFVQSFHESNQSMFGLSASHSLNPIRGGKWGVTLEEWPWNTYPGYYLGPAVLFSGRTILPLLAAFQTTPMMPFDDIYVTGMCTEKAGINRTSFSSNYTTVYAMSQPATPLACDLRRLISWLTVSATHMNSSHFATDDFYHNRTQCVIVAGSNGTSNTTVDHNEPVKFHFV